MIPVVFIRFRPQHSGEYLTCLAVDGAQEQAVQVRLCVCFRPVALNQNICSIRQREAQYIDRVGKSVLGDFTIRQIVATAALVADCR